MEDLKETTHKIHYERFRFDKLREMMGGPRDGKVRFLLKYKQKYKYRVCQKKSFFRPTL